MEYIKENLNSSYDERIEKIINTNKNIIFDFFEAGLEELPFNVYIYDTIENLVKGFKKEDLKMSLIICVLVIRMKIIH